MASITDLNALLGTGLNNLTTNKLNQITNRNAFLQPSPAQQTLHNLFGNQAVLTPTSKSVLEGLQPLDTESIEEITTEKSPEYKALGIKEQQPVLTAAEKKQQQQFALAEKREAHRQKLAEQKAAHALKLKEKEPKKLSAAEQKSKQAYVDKIASFKKVSQDQNLTLDRMDELIDEGGLPIAAFYSLFKNLEENINPVHAGAAGSAIGGAVGAALGGPAGAALGATVGGVGGSLVNPVATLLRYAQRSTSPNTEEFEKLSSSFIRGVKEIFGNRITNVDINEFLKTIPTLANTDYGKKQIIRNMRIFLQANNYRYKALKQVIGKNNGEIPENVEFQVDRIAGPKISQLASKFKTGLPKKKAKE